MARLIPMRMKWAALGFVGLDLFFALAGGTRIAHVAHLGGALFAWLYFRYAHRLDRIVVERQVRAQAKRGPADLRELDEMREVVGGRFGPEFAAVFAHSLGPSSPHSRRSGGGTP